MQLFRRRGSLLTPQRLESAVRALNAGPFRWSSRQVTRAALWHARRHPGSALGARVMATLLRPAACCPDGTVHFRFLQHFVDHLRQCGAPGRLADFAREAPPAQAAEKVEAFARIAVLGILRHELLSACSGREQFPSMPLIEAQIAAWSECDLDCAGCYSRDDRAGRAVDKETLAWHVDEAAACGACAIHLLGKGEPFLHEARGLDLLQVAAERPHLMFVVATHGLSLTPRLMDGLASCPNVLPLVSVDGPREAHDARRGAGTHARVSKVLSELKSRRVTFGVSTMISASSYEAAASESFLEEQASAGSVLAVFSRYFPMASRDDPALRLVGAHLAEYERRLARIRSTASIPILDVDEVEQHSGCRSRAGLTVYIDAIRGTVHPCIRVPHAPEACRLDRASGRGLAQVLRSDFFETYRAAGGSPLVWCGEDFHAELMSIRATVSRTGGATDALDEYAGRVRGSRHRLALMQPGRDQEASS